MRYEDLVVFEILFVEHFRGEGCGIACSVYGELESDHGLKGYLEFVGGRMSAPSDKQLFVSACGEASRLNLQLVPNPGISVRFRVREISTYNSAKSHDNIS